MAKTLSRKVTIYVNGKEVESTLKSLSSELAKLKRQQAQMTIGTQEYVEAGLKIKEITDIIKAQENAMKKNNGEWEHAVEMVSRYSNVIMGVQSAIQMFDNMTGKMKDLAAKAAEMDDVYSDVQKTTGLTREEVAQLNEEFKKIDTRTSREELNKLAYEAGKLGISSLEGVLQFVRASDKINIALGDVLGEGAMVAIGKMADVYTQSTEELKAAGDDLEKKMLAIGSAVNQLGQESTANEHYMVDFTARMGGIAVQANMSAGQVLGFASALDQSMQKVEMSATAFQKFIGQIMKKPEEFAKQANMSVQEFNNLVRTDLNEALLRVLEGFKGKGGYAELVNIFKDLGLDGARAATVISSMANNIEKITDAQWIANEQLRERNSIEDEFDKKNNNRQAEREKAMKAYNDMCEQLGNILYPLLIRLTKLGTGILKIVAAFVDILKEDWKYSLVVAGALAALFRTRLALAAATLRERLAIEGNIFARGKETREMRRTQLQLTREQVERLKALKTRLQERVAINNTILAKRQELIASGQLNVVYAAEARAKRLNAALTKTENMLIDAQKSKTIALSAVMRSTPWGLIASGVAIVVGWLIKHNAKLDEAKQKERELAAEEARVAESSSKAKVEIERYTQRIKERLEKGGDETTLLNALNTKYGEIFGTYDTLAKWYDVLVSKVEDYVQALLLEAKAKKSIDDAAEMDAQIDAYRKMKAESMEEVESLNGLQKAWFNLRANVYGVRQKIGGFFSGGTPNMPGRIFDWEGAVEGWRNNGPQQEVDRLWNTYFDNQERQKQQVIADMEETRDAYIQASEDMLKESARLQASGGFKIVSGEMVTEGDMPTGGGGGESAKEREKRLKKAAKNLATTVQQAEKLINSSNIKAESGLGKVADEITSKFDEMERSILSAAQAAGKVRFDEETGEVKEITEDVADLLARLGEAENKLKKAKIDAYIEKAGNELGKMRGKLKGDSSNEYINKVTSAAAELQEQFRKIDEAILQYTEDIKTATPEETKRLNKLIEGYRQLKGEMVTATYSQLFGGGKTVRNDEWSGSVQGKVDAAARSPYSSQFDTQSLLAYGNALKKIEDDFIKQRKSLEDEIEKEEKALKDLIAETNTYPAAITGNTETEIAQREESIAAIRRQIEALSTLQSQAEKAALQGAMTNPLASPQGRDTWSDNVKGKVDEMASSPMMLIGSGDQLNAYGEALAEIEKKYNDLRNSKLLQKEAEDALVESLEQQIAAEREKKEPNEALIASLEKQKEEHGQNAAAIQEQVDGLGQLREEAEEIAKQNAFGKWLDQLIAGIERFGNAATEIWGNINRIIDNQGEKERIAAEKRKDEQIKLLDEQLEEGVISQEDYNDQKEELQNEYDAKEKEIQLEAWRRQKALNTGQAVMESALAILKAWNSAPWPYNAVPIALATAMGIAQVAAIASEPEPYAKGGYVPRRTVYQAGEAGPEWVASNSLLSDPATAPIIEALEAYQRGNRRALADIPMEQINMPVVAAAARELGRRSAGAIGAEVSNGWQTTPQSVTVEMPGGEEAMKLWRELTEYLKDPNNRRAIISRQTMVDFERNESFLRNMARL